MRGGTLGWIARVLVIVVGVHWGIVGLCRYALVAALFGGGAAPLSRIVYALVGIAAIWQLFTVPAQARTP